MATVLITIAVITSVGVLCAILLWGAGRRFKVEEDPRIDEVAALLPGANCGACGQLGCREFAKCAVEAGSLEGLSCPGSSQDMVDRIAAILGTEGTAAEKRVAVLHCNSPIPSRIQRGVWDGPRSCASMRMAGLGAMSCPFGCLGCGDCVAVCPFDAIHLDPATGLPIVDDTKCTGCGKCTAACPQKVLRLRPFGKKGLRVWVGCSNTLPGPQAMRQCKSACIGCGKCAKACPFEAITVSDNIASIDPTLCKLCRKCVAQCPTGAILTANFPPLPQPSNP